MISAHVLNDKQFCYIALAIGVISRMRFMNYVHMKIEHVGGFSLFSLFCLTEGTV